MARSERYIAPSEEERRRIEQANQAAKEFDRRRGRVLRSALKRMKKADLIDVLVHVAEQNRTSHWIVAQQISLNTPVDLLVHDIAKAIDVATQVDDRRLNYNFDYDWRAYEYILHGFQQLVEKGRIEEAKTLALELMKKGNYQIECSDEGLMLEDIENCLRIVISAVAPTASGCTWAREMLRYGCSYICKKELTDLAGRHPRDQ